MTVANRSAVGLVAWRTPFVVIVCGCAIAMVAFGPRSALGQFLTPLSMSHGWGRDVFSLALAFQNLLWGAGQPVAGMIADKYGAPWVLGAGALLYAAGLAMTAYADTAVELNISAGLLIGFGLSCSSFSLVIGALGKLVPPQHRMLAFGAGTAAGSFGQFLFSPLARVLIDQVGWQNALLTFSAIVLVMLPLSLAMATPRADETIGDGAPVKQTARQALMEALGHRSYNFLVLGFFTCGFQLAFVTVHLPAYLLDRGLSADVGAMAIGVIGLFNIAGSLGAGWLSGRIPKRYVLSGVYFTRGAAIVAFMLTPASPASAITFGAVTGLVWLASVPPTNGLVAVMFGTRWLSMLAGFAFLSHQIGGFLGVWLGGFVFERTGSYDLVWWLSVAFCIMSALVNLPIVEKPVVRAVPAAA